MSDTPPASSGAMADMSVPRVLFIIGLQALAFIAVSLALWSLSDRPLAAFVTFGAGEAGLGLALALALIATSAALSAALPGYVEWLVRSQARNYPFLKHGLSLRAIVFVSLCAGIGEEAFFRGAMQTLLGDVLPMPVALALASALFALIHFAQPFISALIFVIGCLFGVVYWQTGSLLTVMVAHAVYDVYALWALQRAMHRFGVFDEEPSPRLHGQAPRERQESDNETWGETR